MVTAKKQESPEAAEAEDVGYIEIGRVFLAVRNGKVTIPGWKDIDADKVAKQLAKVDLDSPAVRAGVAKAAQGLRDASDGRVGFGIVTGLSVGVDGVLADDYPPRYGNGYPVEYRPQYSPAYVYLVHREPEPRADC